MRRALARSSEGMTVAKSKVTARGQISIPAEVRRKLGIRPGSMLEWKEENGRMIVRRTGQYSFEDIHKALFPDGPPKRRSLKQLKEGIGLYIDDQHARGRY